MRPTEALLACPSVRFMRPTVHGFADFPVERLKSVEGIHGSAAS